MGESAAASSADGDASEVAKIDELAVVRVDNAGDIILDVTFETSADTLKRGRKTASKKSLGAPSTASTKLVAPILKPRFTIAYRVSMSALTKHSKYFANLLSNVQFSEAKSIQDAHQALAERNIKPAEAKDADLPRVAITDDDEATRAVGREYAFRNILMIIHHGPKKMDPNLALSDVTTIAIIADRFDCVHVISPAVRTEAKFKWPVTSTKPFVDENGRRTDAEQMLRTKILVPWLFGLTPYAMTFHQASRELITRGSRLWSPFEEIEDPELSAAWWHLRDGLEDELQYRRDCILNTIASVQRHFLALYTSKNMQCKLGYDSSLACDSFQLGQMLRFLVSKNLLFLVDFSPTSMETIPDTAMINIDDLLATLKQCPNYQVDKHHTNCGLKVRIEPILDFIRSMLSASVVSITLADWKKHRADVSWRRLGPRGDGNGGSRSGDIAEENATRFTFTRFLATDQRLRYEGAMHTDRMVKSLFTAGSWDWTPEI